MRNSLTSSLFYISAVYDGLIGFVFLLFRDQLFAYFRITPPNHAGYVQFPALLLIIFAWMFLRIARAPEANRDLIDFGIALKAAYSGTVFYYALTSGIPPMWTWFAWADLAFLILFVIVRANIGARQSIRAEA